MSLGNLSLFAGLGARMDYLDTRQSIIAQNIANANTAGYIPKDVSAPDFGSVLDKAAGIKTVTSPDRTSPMHMNGAQSASASKSREQRVTYDISPSGNAVVIEEQMMKAGEVSMDHSLMSNLYQKNVSMIRMALGGT